MATLNPVSFLLNQASDAKEAQVVAAPAFSLTKVLAAAAIIVTPIATALVDQLKNVTLTADDYVALAIGLLGFLAITASADVLARSLGAAAENKAQVALAGIGHVIPFKTPLAGHRIVDGEDPAVQILASAYADEPLFLVKEAEKLTWVPTSKVRTS